MFEGCKGAVCKCAAVGVICCVAVTHRDLFCQDWGRQLGAYCNEAWDVPHGPDNDQRPIERQQSLNSSQLRPAQHHWGLALAPLRGQFGPLTCTVVRPPCGQRP